MRFKVSMTNDHRHRQEDTVMPNNENEGKRNIKIFNPKPNVL